MLEKLVEWAKQEDAVRALIFLGSQADQQTVDTFSDYDLSVFCDANEAYTRSESWLTQFGNVLVCVKEKVVLENGCAHGSMKNCGITGMVFLLTLMRRTVGRRYSIPWNYSGASPSRRRNRFGLTVWKIYAGI